MFDDAGSFYNGLAQVQKDVKWGYIDTKGKVVIDCIYDAAAWSFNNGLVRVKKDGKWGFIDTKGKVVIDFLYDNAESFNNGFAQVKKNGKYGFIDTTGKLVIDCIYDDVDDLEILKDLFLKNGFEVLFLDTVYVVKKSKDFPIFQAICKKMA